jgi:hypothetical protein
MFCEHPVNAMLVTTAISNKMAADFLKTLSSLETNK